ncbi:MAG: glycosyltransferase family 39 protein [Pirellulales bacterium]|nr:glycosyltransferase family 39 protein [Pirellulales bacterium]
MHTARWRFGGLALIAGLIFFANLGGGALFDEDEPKNAACGQEMLARGDWIVPMFNGELRTDKPVLLYWLMLLAYHGLGVNEFAARFWSALLSLATVLLVGHLGRTLFSERAGFWAGLAMASCLMFDVVARAATPDATLICCMTLGMTLYVRAVGDWRAAAVGGAADLLAQFTPRSRAAWIAVYSAWALAVLAKGPVGIVLPVGILGLFLLLLTRPEPLPRGPGWWALVRWLAVEIARTVAPARVVRAALSLRPLICLAALAVVALPWYVAVGTATEGDWLVGFLGKHNAERFLNSLENHRGPIVYYVVAILAGFFPWSVFLTPSLASATRRLRAAEADRPAYLFVVAWAGLWIGFFSLAATKLPNYVLPSYPALALLVGAFVDRFIAAPQQFSRRLVHPSLVTVAAVGVALCVGLAIAMSVLQPGDVVVALVGLVPLVGGSLCLVCYGRGQFERAMHVFAATAVVLCALAFGWVAPRISRQQNAQPLIAAARDALGPDAQVAAYEYFVPSLVFYAGRPVAKLQRPADVQQFLAASPTACVLTRADQFEALRGELPADVTILARQRRFLRKGEIVLLGRRAATAAQPTAAARR